jgi:hypothetical protein
MNGDDGDSAVYYRLFATNERAEPVHWLFIFSSMNGIKWIPKEKNLVKEGVHPLHPVHQCKDRLA